MKTMGFVISHKNNEARRALMPADLDKVQHVNQLYFETGYGESAGCRDEEYERAGANIVARAEALAWDMIEDVKLGDAGYVDEIGSEKTVIGWARAARQIEVT